MVDAIGDSDASGSTESSEEATSTPDGEQDAQVHDVSKAVYGAQAAASGDFALSRVPASSRYSWASMALENFSQCGCISTVLIGAQLGHGLQLDQAIWATLIGACILAAICTLLGTIGCREGLTTSMLGRWTGLGCAGTAVLSLMIALSLMGWFGIQSAIAGKGLEDLFKGLPDWGWTAISGLVVTVISMLGFRWMVAVAFVSGPAFLVVIVWACVQSLSCPPTKLPPEQEATLASPQLHLIDGVGLVVGGWIVGAVVSADIFRFSRSGCAVASQVLLARTPSLVLYSLAGALVAHTYHTADIIHIMHESVGWAAVVVVVAGELVINCANLYIAGLAVVSFCDVMLGCNVARSVVTLVCGIVGGVLGAAGILSHFINFLSVLSVTFPPVAGIVSCEYFAVRAFSGSLDDTRRAEDVPKEAYMWVPAALVAWVAAALLGYFVPWGFPSLYSFFGAAVLYALAGGIGALRSFGSLQTAGQPRVANRADEAV